MAADSKATLRALGSPDPTVANRAEWILVEAGPSVLPGVRALLQSDDQALCERAIRIVAWQYDTESLTRLRTIHDSGRTDAALAAWAIHKIEVLALAMPYAGAYCRALMASFRTDVLSAEGKSAGMPRVTAPVAAHSTPLENSV